jgi:hypothetical protein
MKRRTLVQRAANYGMDQKKTLGFSLKNSQLDEMLAVMRQFIDGFVHIGQRRVLLLLLEAGIHLGLPAA